MKDYDKLLYIAIGVALLWLFYCSLPQGLKAICDDCSVCPTCVVDDGTGECGGHCPEGQDCTLTTVDDVSSCGCAVVN